MADIDPDMISPEIANKLTAAQVHARPKSMLDDMEMDKVLGAHQDWIKRTNDDTAAMQAVIDNLTSRIEALEALT